MNTDLTKFFDIQHPIILAPMAIAGGGRLAAAVSNAGGLGLIGGGYGDQNWLEREFNLAGGARVGCGLITWKLRENPALLAWVLDQKPAAMFLSFGDPTGFAKVIKDSGVPMICQVQTLRDAAHAIDCGADVIVAQGAEAGGHGERRATMTLVPEAADYISKNAANTILCAAGGIADGRGLAAALMLGADGVLVGSRFWASHEALVAPRMHAAAVCATGDQTIRSDVMDAARDLTWPDRYTARVLKNQFTDKWHGQRDKLTREVGQQWQAAFAQGDPDGANTFVGEATGLINDIKPAAQILDEMVTEAKQVMTRLAANIGVVSDV
ncbi:MAG: nitronate monooxygenase [Rhodobacteraceae bacterium]|nr:nitronate monooxygenase [Paracoccaceae bacterium]